MGSFSRILLPVDFSERSVAAARYARSLAGYFGSEILLLHVLTPPQYEFGELRIGGSTIEELYRGRAQQATAELDAFLAAELAGMNVERAVVEGDPAGKIVECAAARGVDIIMMPTHGFGPYRRFILGSNTAKVLHDAECPVWTRAHIEQAPSAAAAVPLRAIVCAVDLGSESSKTLFWAASLAREFGARLTLLHATAGDADIGDDSEVNWRIDVREAAEQELSRLRGFVNAEADLLIEAGEPAKVICATAARLQADALVIGRGSAAGLFGRLRTNAYAIIRQAPCPVVSV
ncbi:MAG: universal stress protein [Bryobacteraceae bacterium]|jgi:nucleotide-binding universal stress UspA family protein